MRHAKSDWSSATSDFMRPLNPRGREAAEKMGLWLKYRNSNPDRVISSPAERAKQTCRTVCRQTGMPETIIQWDERIYEAATEDLLAVINEHKNHGTILLLVGHNPGLDGLVKYLADTAPDRSSSGKLMTTGAIAVISFEQGFDGKAGSGRVLEIARPKDI